ncbi:unnamed protein product [Acanthoscelides obtectus]|uniref:Exonuclease domain-containing protein n=2 Tax=Acanthoscelides obtectus TaxID=200917 RepID=A0A9P0JRG0_ACAOB|nr:unnamed protein product [Acanthoscelides obtectus]CAK1668045.1 RNA exonuclease 5 [Acanthoscelides obtectus]
MTGESSKRRLRIENKKKKMAALLDIVKLNEYDRAQKSKQKEQETQSPDSPMPETEPSAKRLKSAKGECINRDESLMDEPPPPKIGELGPSGKPKLEGDELIALKKVLREKTTRIKNQPNFKLRELGVNASLTTNINDRVPMFLSDLQHLIMYSQIGVHSPYSPARWCALDKYNRLTNTNLLVIENVSLYDFLNHESLLPFLSSTFDHKLEMITPASYKSDIVKDLSMVPLTGSQMKKFINSFGTLEEAVLQSDELFDTVKNFFPMEEDVSESICLDSKLPASDKFPRTQLLLSGWQMVEENFPLPIQGLVERKYAGYRLTKDKYKDVTPFSPMFAIDCEMCKTSTGELELTRVSVVDENLKVFYDTLVKPDNEIVDYLTKWSGINKKMMRNVTTKLKNVQEELKKLLPQDAILVGQSLANDLHALKMMHPYIIDTSVVYNLTGDRSRKTKLQTLARELLKEKIQTGHQGHCSTEDSLACMKLVQLRLTKHLYYGDAVMNNVYSELRAYPDMGTSHYATSMLRQCVKVDKRVNVIALDDIGQRYKFYVNKGEEVTDVTNVTCIQEKSNKEVIKRFCDSMINFSLNIAHIRIADGQLEGTNPKILKNIDMWVKEIYERSSMSSLVIVLFGGQKHGNGTCFIKLKRELV